MAGPSRSVDPLDPTMVDDSYFSALFDDDEIFPISDEKYAEELALQEALVSATSRTNKLIIPKKEIKEERYDHITTSHFQKESYNFKGKTVKSENCQSSGDTTRSSPASFCVICMDSKPSEEMFKNDNCSHSFCSDCIGKYVATKIQENISRVKCPEPKCDGVLEPQLCRSIVPKQVFDRWESALCESLVLGLARFYCPFTDCSEMMFDDEDRGEAVTVSECPNCHRLFCAQCNVPWHQGVECEAFRAARRDGSSEKADKMAVELAERKNWRRCPGCYFFVEKNEGCMHISCRCGKEFCYKCGCKWISSHSC